MSAEFESTIVTYKERSQPLSNEKSLYVTMYTLVNNVNMVRISSKDIQKPALNFNTLL